MPKYLGQPLADKLSEIKGLPPEDREIVAYGLEYLLSGASGVVLALSIGFLLGMLRETTAVIICWGMMRLFAGGSHCTTLWRCTVASLTFITAATLLSRGVSLLIPTEMFVPAAITWTVVAVQAWAPNNSEKPVRDAAKRREMRRRALLLVSAAAILLLCRAFSEAVQLQAQGSAGATGLAGGAFLLSPPGFRIVERCNKSMEYLYQIFFKGGELP